MKTFKQKSATELQKEVDSFNSKFKVGETVQVLTDSGATVQDTIRYEASIMGGHTAMAWLLDKGSYKLDRVSKIPEQAPELGQSFTKLTPESTSVAKIEYNPTVPVFSITFKTNGAVYDYVGVTHEDAFKAWNSESMGKLPKVELKDYKGTKRS